MNLSAVKRDFELEIPIIQGGMGVGVSMGRLAGSVMACGGMGVLSAADPGYKDPDYWTNPMDCNRGAIIEACRQARALSGGRGLLGCNVMVACNHYEALVTAAIDGGADAIISGAGLPMNLPSIPGTDNVLIAPIVSSARAAKLILKSWHRHYERCADFIVIEGYMAGGHLGFKREDLEAGTCETNAAILEGVLKEIIPYEEAYGKKIPVFVAGGIYTGSDVKDMIGRGAAGVQVGTRFIATYECDADDAFKQAIIQAEPDDIMLVKSPAGLPGRAVRTPFIERAQHERIAPKRCIDCIKPCKPAETLYCITQALINSACGDVDDGLVFCGSNAWRIDKIQHVSAIIDELMSEL